MINYEDFIFSLNEENPPEKLDERLKILWYDANGNWDKAHEIAQSMSQNDGSLLHAYLHRKEGDHANARYWYSSAGEKMPEGSLIREWERLLNKFLDSNHKK